MWPTRSLGSTMPKQTTDIFEEVLKSDGFDVEVVDTLDVFLDDEKCASVDLIVPCWTMSTIWLDRQLCPD